MPTCFLPPTRLRIASLLWALVLPAFAAGAESGKAQVVVSMVRIQVATQNPAVNQTYELEIDSFDGQRLRGFEPEPPAGAVRSLISIDMASVRSLQFFQRTIERAAPAATGRETDTPPQPPHPPRESSKELQRRFDRLVREGGEAQLTRIFETLQSPQEYRQLENHLVERMNAAATPEELQAAVRAAQLVEFLSRCTAAARNFEDTTSAQYFAEIPQWLREAHTDTAQLAHRIESEANRDQALKLLDAQDIRMIAKPLAERVWNQTVPPERAVQPQTRRFGNGNGNGPRPFKNNPRPGRPPEP